MHHILRNNFLSFLTLTPSLWTNEPEAVFTSQELRALLRMLPFTQGFGGHTTRVYAGYETVTTAPLQYFTFLREPVERYVSHFRYQIDSMDIPWSFEAFLREPRFANFMTNRIAGGPDVDRAKELLRERFSFVGLTARFDESLLLLRNALGLPTMDVHYEHKNAGRISRGTADQSSPLDDPGMNERIKDQNRLDLELYEFVRETLYPEYVDRYGTRLTTDLDILRRENEGFHFSVPRRYAWGLYRKLVYQPAELAIRRRYHRPMS